MPVYQTSDQVTEAFAEAFRTALKDDAFRAALAEGGLSFHFVLRDPAAELFVSDAGVETGAAPPPAAMRFELDADAMHEIFTGQLGLTAAVVARRLRFKGRVSRMRELADLFPALAGAYVRQLRAAAR